MTIAPSESSSLDVALYGAARSATISRVFNLALTHSALGLSPRARAVKLKPTRRLLGTARKFMVELVVIATDRAGNRATVTRTFSVKH